MIISDINNLKTRSGTKSIRTDQKTKFHFTKYRRQMKNVSKTCYSSTQKTNIITRTKLSQKRNIQLHKTRTERKKMNNKQDDTITT